MSETAVSGVGDRSRGHQPPAAWIAILLFAVTAVVYGRAVTFDFVNYDDDVYVYQNPRVQAGLNWDGVRWAFSTGHAGNWHPLTWLSLQSDVWLFGRGAAGHHAVNVVLHAANASLLFLTLYAMTRACWPATAAAALFALHPLRVESVAWIAERKDVLCGLFWLLAMMAYAAYARRGGAVRYGAVLMACALALMAKPMAVTLPFALLLLDIWPLSRGRWIWRLTEKLPLIMLSAAAAGATVWAQHRGGAITGEAMRLSDRLLTAGFGYAQYIIATVWPVGLAPFYPHPAQPPGTGLGATAIAISSTIVVALLAVAIACRRRAPWNFVGFLWFFGTLVPVIGLIQVGLQSHADRYTYIPSIGIAIALAWTVHAIVPIRAATAVAAVACLGLALLTVRQLGFWRDSLTLWRHSIDVVPQNYIAHGNLGHALHARGDRAGAMEQFRRSIEINPRYGQGLHNYGAALASAGRDAEALPFLQRALEIGDTRAATTRELDLLYARSNQPDAAITLYEAQLTRNPNDPAALHGFAMLRAQRREVPAAIDLWRRAAALAPNDPEIHHGLGLALVLTGRHREGVEHLRAAAEIRPDRIETLTWLAWTLASSFDPTVRKPADALAFAEQASRLTSDPPITTLDALAAAQAAMGQFDRALTTIRRAMEKADATGRTEVAASLTERQRLYESGKPYVQPLP